MQSVKRLIVLFILASTPFAVEAASSFSGLLSGEEGCSKSQECLRVLWPQDSARPGKRMTELSPLFLEGTVEVSSLAGDFEAKKIDWKDQGGKTLATSLLYPVPSDGFSVFVFETTVLEELSGNAGRFGDALMGAPAIKLPSTLDRVLVYDQYTFAPAKRRAVPTQGPVIAYNDDMDVMIVSALDHFLSVVQEPQGGEWLMGFHGLIERVPSGTSLPVLVVKGQGINAAMEEWGRVLRSFHGRDRTGLYDDIALSRLGYWTDNGAYYYYNTEPGMNYHETLMAVKDYADEAGIPYNYFQINSWWYPKAKELEGVPKARGGCMVWEPKKDMFPAGLDGFVDELGLPLVAHNRWYDKLTPYCDEYECVYGVGKKEAALPVDPEFWDEIMDNALLYGVSVYEQDWLLTQYDMIPWLTSGIGNAESWYDAMIEAADGHGLTMQICMASPGFFLQQVKHPNVTHTRTSTDYRAFIMKGRLWDDFFMANMLAWSTGMLPFKDNFHTMPGQSQQGGEHWPFEETLMSSLSAGPVGPSDRIGMTDVELVMKTCRSDGLLLKPDRPATMIDSYYAGRKMPIVTSTWSDHEAGRVTYLAAFDLYPMLNSDYEVTLDELGLSGEHVIYDYRQKSAVNTSGKIRFAKMDKNTAHYYILSPVLDNKMAFIGEDKKFITASAARFKEVSLEEGTMNVVIEKTAGEEVSFLVHSDHAPESDDAEIKSLTGGLYRVSPQGTGATTDKVQLR